MNNKANNKRKLYLSYAAIVILIIITGKLIFLNSDVDNMKYLFNNTKRGYLFLGILMLGAYWALDTYGFFQLGKGLNIVQNKLIAFKLTMIGQYYSLVTPFASGGQPAQLYAMGKHNISLGKSTVILANKFIIYQITVTIYSVVLFLVRINSLFGIPKTATYFILWGLLANIIGLVIIMMLIYNSKYIEKILYFIIRIPKKLGLIKDSNIYKEKIKKYIEEYKNSSAFMARNKKLIAKVFFITFLQLTAYFSITYFIYRALGLEGTSFIKIISLQSLLYMAVSFIPIPGTIGASELGFYTLLGGVFNHNVVTYAMLLWRGISYYFNLCGSGIIVLAFYLIDRRKRKPIVIE